VPPSREFLRQTSLFEGLADADLEHLAKLCEDVGLAAHSEVFAQGDETDAFYVVRSGRVVVIRDALGKPVQLLAHLEAGDFFGELGLLGEAPRSASVRTAEPSRLLRIAKGDFFTLLDRHPSFALEVQNVAIRRHSANVAAALALSERGELRIRLRHDVELELASGKVYGATLENLSPGGLSLSAAPTRWQKGQKVDFVLVFEELRLALRGRITWRDGDRLGLAFTGKGADHETQIQSALRRLLQVLPRERRGT